MSIAECRTFLSDCLRSVLHLHFLSQPHIQHVLFWLCLVVRGYTLYSTFYLSPRPLLFHTLLLSAVEISPPAAASFTATFKRVSGAHLDRHLSLLNNTSAVKKTQKKQLPVCADNRSSRPSTPTCSASICCHFGKERLKNRFCVIWHVLSNGNNPAVFLCGGRLLCRGFQGEIRTSFFIACRALCSWGLTVWKAVCVQHSLPTINSREEPQTLLSTKINKWIQTDDKDAEEKQKGSNKFSTFTV